jgi:beta-lactamase superfamily II metal-dependent hydrolase
MQVRISLFSVTVAGFLLCTSCTTQQPAEHLAPFTFTVVDVGQGLSQIGSSGGGAIVWDMGDTGTAVPWLRAYHVLQDP